MKSPVRILYLAPCWPTEGLSGWQSRTVQVLRALQEFGELDCIVAGHGGDRLPDPETGSPAFVREEVRLKRLGPRSIWDRLRCGFDARYLNYYGYTALEPDRRSVLGRLSRYDIVWLHHLRTANVFGRWCWERSVMDLDDVQSKFSCTVRENSNRLKERLRERIRAHVARRRERFLGERFSVLAVCSEADREYLGFADKTHVIPNGFAIPSREPTRNPAKPPRIGFIGTFEYRPNSDCIRWFAENCWPRIKQQLPDARLRLVGKGSDGHLKPAGRDIDSLGWVKDPAAEVATWSVLAVPVRTGTGTRVKIAEGFSRKCPMVSTSLGAYGYAAEDGREMLLADAAEDFADACVKLIREPGTAAEMAERAWQSFQEKWTWDRIRPRIWEAAEDCLRRNTDR